MNGRNLSRKGFLKLGALSAVGAASLGAGGFAYAHEVEPDRVEIVRLDLTLPRLAPAFDGYRLVQISDLHADERTTPERLARTFETANGLDSDLVAITGDFVTSRDVTARPLEDFPSRLSGALRTLRARDGVVAVLGNHDHWSGPDEVRRVIRDGGTTDLSNAARTLRRGGSELHVAGVDSVMEGENRLGRVLDGLPGSGAAVLLAHEPDFADTSAATGRFDLQLSGHSHGGQVRVPLFGPPVLPPLAEKYPEGLYRVVDGMLLYTNRGLGMLPPRVRFNCPPEITVLTLRAAGANE